MVRLPTYFVLRTIESAESLCYRFLLTGDPSEIKIKLSLEATKHHIKLQLC